jgi:hypothetical protein
MNKDKVLEAVGDLPQNFEFDVLLEKLIFIEKVEQGLQDIKNGDTLTHEEVLQEVKEWQK